MEYIIISQYDRFMTNTIYLKSLCHNKSHPPTFHEIAISFFEMDNSCILKLKTSSPKGDTRF